jgi:hypothetical protein
MYTPMSAALVSPSVGPTGNSSIIGEDFTASGGSAGRLFGLTTSSVAAALSDTELRKTSIAAGVGCSD